MAAWSQSKGQTPLIVGTRFDLDGLSIAREVRRSGGPAWIQNFAGATRVIAQEARAAGIRSSVGCPIMVAGRLWG
ncbi:GAF domain-containing protein [Streptomyces sp. NPDC002896]|uniref:GAF domain-containing protein n=1 Tax=Streptomyces sp. NPDC002896 TaxID=3154438 RepID=UPI003331B0B2